MDALANWTTLHYLALAATETQRNCINTRKERITDDIIDYPYVPCRVFDRSNLHSWRQTLARVLSLETNVTSVTPPSH